MMGSKVLVKMLHVPPQILGPVLSQHPDSLVDRHPLGRRFAEPAVRKSIAPFLLVAPPAAPELPLRAPEKLPAFIADNSCRSPRLNMSRNLETSASCGAVATLSG